MDILYMLIKFQDCPCSITTSILEDFSLPQFEKCPRLPHEGPISPTVTTTCTVFVNMVTSLIEPTKMDENEYEVFLVNPQRTFKSLAKATIERSIDEEYANCPSPPPKNQGMLEL